MNHLPNEINRLIFSFLFKCKNKRLFTWDVERNNFNCIINKETYDIFNNITRLCKIKRHFTCKYQNLCINCDKYVLDPFCDWKPWNENEIEQLKYETRDITTTQDSDPCWRRLSSVLLHQEHTSRSPRECHKTYIELKLWKKKSDILSLSGMLTFEERRRAMGFN